MRHFRRHADAFAQRRVWVDGFDNVHGVCAHFDGECDLANHVARVPVHHVASQDLAVAAGLGLIVKQQFGHGIKATIDNGAA
jgi:hypothetical protein